jgi:hypothetical protein
MKLVFQFSTNDRGDALSQVLGALPRIGGDYTRLLPLNEGTGGCSCIPLFVVAEPLLVSGWFATRSLNDALTYLWPRTISQPSRPPIVILD